MATTARGAFACVVSAAPGVWVVITSPLPPRSLSGLWEHAAGHALPLSRRCRFATDPAETTHELPRKRANSRNFREEGMLGAPKAGAKEGASRGFGCITVHLFSATAGGERRKEGGGNAVWNAARVRHHLSSILLHHLFCILHGCAAFSSAGWNLQFFHLFCWYPARASEENHFSPPVAPDTFVHAFFLLCASVNKGEAREDIYVPKHSSRSVINENAVVVALMPADN